MQLNSLHGRVMSRYSQFDRNQIRLASLSERQSDVSVASLARPGASDTQLPHVSDTVTAIHCARQSGRPVIAMIGGHPIKLGLSRFLIELIENDLITCLATNGAGIIHDFELAAFGETSENVTKWISKGQFGLWKQTDQLNQIVSDGARRDEGFGEAVGRTIEEEMLPHRDISIAAAGWRCGVPVTCHIESRQPSTSSWPVSAAFHFQGFRTRDRTRWKIRQKAFCSC